MSLAIGYRLAPTEFIGYITICTFCAACLLTFCCMVISQGQGTTKKSNEFVLSSENSEMQAYGIDFNYQRGKNQMLNI